MAERWRIEFSDLQKVEWRISIEDPDFTGDYTLLKATGNPLNFAYDNESDDVFDPMRPSRATFEVYSETNFALLDLYSVEDMHYPVNIYCNEALYWTGYIETQNYEEVYEPVPYAVSITATDGLSILENILFADNIAYSEGEETITYYNGHELESAIILDILAEIGFTEFKEYVNIYEDDMVSTASDSPFDQIKIDRDVFKDYYCYEVLSELLRKYNAIIRQKDGVFCIVRPAELLDTTVYGRWFTGDTTKTAITLNPDQFLKRKNTHPSARRIQLPGGRLMIAPPAKKVSSYQDYGNRQSWIDNYDFDSDSWNGTDFQFWTKSASSLICHIGQIVPGEKAGVYLYNRNTYPTLAYYIYQSFGTEAIISTYDIFNFEFDFMTVNNEIIAKTGVKFYVRIKCDDANYWLVEKDDTEAIWQNTAGLITVETDAPLGFSSWSTWRRTITGLPAAGSYTIYIYNSDYTDNVRVGVKNVKFYATSDEILVKTRKHKGPFKKLGEWVLMNNPFGKDPTAKLVQVSRLDFDEITESEYHVYNGIVGNDRAYNYVLGDVVDADMDNTISQCKGALGVMKRVNGYRVDTIILTGTTGACDIIVGGLSDTAIFSGDLSDTAADFVTNNVLAFDSIGITLTSAGSHLIFTSKVLGADFEGDTSIVNVSGNLFGTITYTTPAYSETLEPSDKWNFRGESNYKPLLHHIADEIALEYSKPRQLIQMPLLETAQGVQIDVIGNFQDDINTSGGETRVFVLNRAEFDVRKRRWEADLHEIGTRTAEEEDGEGGSTTADSTVITVDDDTILVDTI
jgi:hypothetical protein